ncbi:unnamed protein product [Toxocara canis]|uniref:PHD domain-containing protein n=1 Tax=Toxocara canis TaxID=6265 RepID=A0A183U2J7_TOXCA|nr:unnamed protein product [Toxocara canis]
MHLPRYVHNRNTDRRAMTEFDPARLTVSAGHIYGLGRQIQVRLLLPSYHMAFNVAIRCKLLSKHGYIHVLVALDQYRSATNILSADAEGRSLAVGDTTTDMVGCDACDNWFHWSCVGLLVAPPLDVPWYCQSCAKKNAKRSSSSGKGAPGGKKPRK